MKRVSTEKGKQLFVAVLVMNLLFPLIAAPASAQIFTRKQNNPPAKPGMSTGKKVLLLGGAALLYFLWRKHQASVAQHRGPNGQMAGNGQTPQLYRSRNGGIYYRDQNGQPVWLTVPNQQVAVPATEVQRYAPNYRRYRGQAPVAPSGYRSQPFSDFDSSALPAGSPGGTGMMRQ